MVMISFFKQKVYEPGHLVGKYKIIRLMGEGRFGICYLVESNSKQYIFKELKLKAIKKIGKKVTFEKKILSSINHPSIPRIIETIKNDNIYAYTLEYKDGKAIEDMLFKDNHTFTSAKIYKIGIKIINIIKISSWKKHCS